MDTGRWGPGERLVFEPYTREVYAESFDWIAKRDIFPEGGMGTGKCDEAVFAGNPFRIHHEDTKDTKDTKPRVAAKHIHHRGGEAPEGYRG